MPELPAWARWVRHGPGRPWTVGVEEEVTLQDPETGAVVNVADDVTAALAPELAGRVGAETHACVLELRTDPHATVAAVAAQLAALRVRLRDALHEMGLIVAAAGTHALATRSEVAVSSGPRYREIDATMRALARREPTMALHVHVAVPDREAAVRALDGIRADLPVLLALSANSPFWRGRDSGFASIRTPVFSMFPRVGIPRRFGSYAAYVRAVDRLVRCGAIREPGFLWWDARLQPARGTVEVRIMDAQSRVRDTAGIAALVQCLVHRHATRRRPGTPPPPEVLAEERFLAARDGLEADLIGVRTTRPPARRALEQLLAAGAEDARELGCTAELELARHLAADPGYARQRRLAEAEGLAAVPFRLAQEFAACAGVFAPA